MNKLTSNAPTIIYIKNEKTRNIAFRALEMLSLTNKLVPGSFPGLNDTLRSRPNALLITDWQEKETVRILDCSKREQSIDLRPILLIVENESPGILKVFSDYHVSGIFAGIPSSQDIYRELVQIFDTASPAARFRGEYEAIAAARGRGEYGYAIKLLKKLAKEFPKNHRIECEIVDAYIHLEKWAEAGQAVESILMREPEHPRALHLKARCCLKMGQIDQATELLEKSTVLSPLNADRLVEFGECLLKKNKPLEAEKNFKKALDIHPEKSRAKIGLGTSQFMLGNHNEALNFIKTLTSDQERGAIFNNSAILCVAQKDFATGIRLYDIGIPMVRQLPSQAKLIFNKSLAYFKSGDRDKGFLFLKKAIDLDPNFIRAKEFLEYQNKLPDQGSSGDWDSMSEMTDLDVGDLDEFF